MDVECNVRQAMQDVFNMLTTGSFIINLDDVVQWVEVPRMSCRDFVEYLSNWENSKVLLGIAYSWFATDIHNVADDALVLLS